MNSGPFVRRSVRPSLPPLISRVRACVSPSPASKNVLLSFEVCWPCCHSSESLGGAAVRSPPSPGGLRGAGWLRAPRSCPGISAALGVAGAEDSSEGRFNPVLSYCAWTLRVLFECRPGCRSSRSTGNESKGKWSCGFGEGFMASGARVSFFFFFFLAALGFSVILFGYIKYFRRLSWSLIC